jgi:TM2 domain-containing membrane protein YozV
MNNQLLYRWTPVVIFVLFIVTGIILKQRNNKLATANNTLVLQNDSILSVNLQLTKEVSKLQRLLDSFSIKNSSARLGN